LPKVWQKPCLAKFLPRFWQLLYKTLCQIFGNSPRQLRFFAKLPATRCNHINKSAKYSTYTPKKALLVFAILPVTP
jgi:hypothetical protein